ncbi:MarR family winged helix-turn-helix transcriptional regulator [Nocardioides yefusunii]|uniref:MarR family winged helix-turn-helix transcriptional regulator n=1 Tax=Nocardioides yefusunii TaxID=2500546 RepID=A0ABW1QXT1_9ACTN|nr:MarR family transcriptional regulator [Nocardioides yefusunii]
MTTDTAPEPSPDDDLVADLRLGVMRMRRRLVNERHPDNDLSISHMGVLAMLHRHGACTPSRLAQLERVQPPSMTRTVNLLADRGLVSRAPDAVDRRVTHVHLTDAGRAVLAADRHRRDAWLARRLDELDHSDREALRRAASVLLRLAQED